MSDENAETTGGLEALSESALRDRHAANAARIAELREQDSGPSLTDAREINTLAAESRKIAELVAEFAVDSAEGELPEPPTVDEIADEVVEAVDTENLSVEDAMADGGTDDTGVEHFTDDRVHELAVAAAAALANTISQPTVAATNVGEGEGEGDTSDVQQAGLVASAAHTRGAVTVGDPIDLGQIGELVQALAHDRGSNGQNIALVNLTAAIGEDTPRVSADASRAENTRAMAEALTAAPFEVCGPPDILRDVPECDNVDRYVPGLFRTVPSTHGDIQYYRSFGIADVVDSVSTWGADEQKGIDEADPTTWKQCGTVGCLPTDTIGVEAVVQCLCMQVFQTMTSREAVASAIRAVRAYTARVADGQLLDRYDALSSQYTFDAGADGAGGAATSIYDLLGRLLGVSAAANRQIDLSGYTLALEVGMLQTLTLDQMLVCGHEAQAVAEDMFGGLGIGNIAVTPDWSTADGAGPWSPALPINAPGAAPVVVPPRPTDFKVRLFRSSDFAMLTPGGDTFGIVPDLNNKRQNKVCWFGEIFQGLGKLGCSPSFTIEVSNLCASGQRGACDYTCP